MDQKITFSEAVSSSKVISPPDAAIRIESFRLSPMGKAALSGTLRSVTKNTAPPVNQSDKNYK
jgi:hypothetical protein